MKLKLITVLLGLFLTRSLSKPLNSSKILQFDDIYKLKKDSNFDKFAPKLWNDRIVYYQIERDIYQFKYMITEAMETITRETGNCIHFIRRRNEENYISFQKGNCNSHVGMIGGAQELHLDYSCCETGNIIHELMHALGYFHEHSRPDRDEYLNIFLENVEENKKHNFVKLNTSQYPYDLAKYEFDFESIMIYGEYAFTKNGDPTMSPKEWIAKRIVNPQFKKHLSRLNVQLVRSTYGCDELYI